LDNNRRAATYQVGLDMFLGLELDSWFGGFGSSLLLFLLLKYLVVDMFVLFGYCSGLA